MEDIFVKKNYLLYADWAKKNELPAMTGNQAKLVEVLIAPENAKFVAALGDMETIFKSVRQFLKADGNLQTILKEEI